MQSRRKLSQNLLLFFVLLLPIFLYGQVGSLRINIAGRELPPAIRGERRGERILLPVAPIARELGYLITIDNPAERIRVRRVGIESEFIKQTAEVRENGVTIVGVPSARDVAFLSDTNSLLLPLEVITPLLNVSISVDEAQNLVRIESRDSSSAVSIKPRSRLAISTLNYNYGSTFAEGAYFQNLNLYSLGRIGSSVYQTTASFLGGNFGVPITFYGGNFTLQRKKGDEIQIGDVTNTIGSELSLLNTLVRGGSYSRPLLDNKASLSIYGGRSFSGINENLFQNTQTLQFDTTLIGSRVTYNPFKTLQTPLNQTPASRKSLSFGLGGVFYRGRNNDGAIADFTARYNTEKINLEAEISVGSFDVKTLGNRELKGFGTGMIFAASYRPWRFLSLQGRYDRYSPNFTNPTRTNQYSNRETKAAGFTLQPFRNLSFGGNVTISNNKNPIFFGNSFFERFKTEAYGVNFAYDPNIKFLPRASVNATSIRSPILGKLNLVYVNLSREYEKFRPFANYILSQTGNNRGHSLSTGSSVDIGNLGQLQIQQSFSFNTSPFARQDPQCIIGVVQCPGIIESRLLLASKSGNVDWNPNRYFFKRFQFSIGGGYVSDRDLTTPVFRSNVAVKLPFEQQLQISYFKSGFGNELRFGISGPLTFWKSKATFNDTLISNDSLLLESTIEGRVFQDENGNRIYDHDIDIPMNGVRIRLNNGIEVTSNEYGLYKFEKVLPGEHRVAVNIQDIRANLIPANGLEQNLTVTPRSIVNTPFRMVKSGAVRGRVWVDLNADGAFNEGEGLGDIHILTSSGLDTYTDQDGSFQISELPPGIQTLFIDERYKPEDFVAKNLNLRVEIRSGEITEKAEFLFASKPREVKEKDFSKP